MNTVRKLAEVKRHAEFFREAIRGESKNKRGEATYKGPDIGLFDEQTWFTGAYYTFQRTLWGEFSPLTEDQKKRAQEVVFKQLPRLESDPAQFKKAWSALLQRLIALSNQPNGSHGISLGHAQKLVSIIVKYAYVAEQLDNPKLPKDLGMMVQSCRNVLPVPLDNIVLKRLKFGADEEFRFERIHCSQKGSPSIDQADDPQASRPWVRWSRLESLKAYWAIQTEIQMLAAKAGYDPIGYELVKLWSRST